MDTAQTPNVQPEPRIPLDDAEKEDSAKAATDIVGGEDSKKPESLATTTTTTEVKSPSVTTTERMSYGAPLSGRKTAYHPGVPPPTVAMHPGTLNPHIPIAFNSTRNKSNDGTSSTTSTTTTMANHHDSSAFAGQPYPMYAPHAQSPATATGGSSSSLPPPAVAAQKMSASPAEGSMAEIPTGFINKQGTYKKSTSKQVQAYLMPEDYEPNENDVLCGRGRTCKVWKGNQAYRTFVASKLDAYSAAGTKLEKGFILSEIVDYVRSKDPPGHFIKKDTDGLWFEVGDFQAR